MGEGLERDEARKQAARLDASPALAPKSDEGATEIVECLIRNCDNEAHAKAVITRLLDGVQRCQSLTAEIAVIATATRKRQEFPGGCSRCKGEPWILTPKGMARCDCARGQALRRANATGRVD